jgi:DNA invertase Pin-like site-specific DNA recombinase
MEFVKEGLTFTGDDSPMATLMLSVMGAFAEFERALIRERQREGITLARQRGAYRGARNPCRRSGSKSCAAAPPPEKRNCTSPKTSALAAKLFTNI